MTAKLKVGVLVVLMIAASAVFAASAGTTASIDRSSNVDVVSDSDGLISLQANTSSGVVQENDTGALSIDFAQGDAQGVNTESRFEIGDETAANTSYAFNITNQNSQSHDLGLEYTDASTNGEANIEFKVYDSQGDSLVTADEENGKVTTPVESAETVYVVLVVDTHGLDTDSDLTGTLTVSV